MKIVHIGNCPKPRNSFDLTRGSLPQTVTQFFPTHGRVRGELFLRINDQGVSDDCHLVRLARQLLDKKKFQRKRLMSLIRTMTNWMRVLCVRPSSAEHFRQCGSKGSNLESSFDDMSKLGNHAWRFSDCMEICLILLATLYNATRLEMSFTLPHETLSKSTELRKSLCKSC